MKKIWETERQGIRIIVICQFTLDDGRIGVAKRAVHSTEWEYSGNLSQRYMLENLVKRMDFDIEQVTAKAVCQ